MHPNSHREAEKMKPECERTNTISRHYRILTFPHKKSELQTTRKHLMKNHDVKLPLPSSARRTRHQSNANSRASLTMASKTSYQDSVQAKETLQSPSPSSLKMESPDRSIFTLPHNKSNCIYKNAYVS